jgi:N-acetylmuramic acid 6-phosphate etherase
MTSTSLDLLPTEQPNPNTWQVDTLDSLGVLELINAEDQLVPLAVHAALPSLARAVDLALGRWKRGGRIVLFGAGTSGRLALLDAAELGPTYRVPPERYEARLAGGTAAFTQGVEGAEDDRSAGARAAADLTANDVAFGLAASGRTPWVLGALERARQRGAITIGMANVPRAELSGLCDICLIVETGPEVVTGSTRMKAGTAQKLVLNAFSTALMVRAGKVYGNLMIDVQASNEKLRRRATRLVAAVTGVSPSAAEQALRDCGWDVKVTIAASRLGLTTDEARARLAAADGNLRRALEEEPRAEDCSVE